MLLCPVVCLALGHFRLPWMLRDFAFSVELGVGIGIRLGFGFGI